MVGPVPSLPEPYEGWSTGTNPSPRHTSDASPSHRGRSRRGSANDELTVADSGSAVTLGLENHPGITMIRVTRIGLTPFSLLGGSSDFGSTVAVAKGCWLLASQQREGLPAGPVTRSRFRCPSPGRLLPCSARSCSRRWPSHLVPSRAAGSPLQRPRARRPRHRGWSGYLDRSSLSRAATPSLLLAARQSCRSGPSVSARARSRSSVCASKELGRSPS